MNEINDRKRHILGAWGAAHQTAMNVNALASKSLRTGKALTDWDTNKVKEYNRTTNPVVSATSPSLNSSDQPIVTANETNEKKSWFW